MSGAARHNDSFTIVALAKANQWLIRLELTLGEWLAPAAVGTALLVAASVYVRSPNQVVGHGALFSRMSTAPFD